MQQANLYKAIDQLRAAKIELDFLITRLEAFATASQPSTWTVALLPPKERRGRKFMGEEERRQVSERMRRYWNNRRVGLTGFGREQC